MTAILHKAYLPFDSHKGEWHYSFLSKRILSQLKRFSIGFDWCNYSINFTIEGLPEAEVKESKDRVRAALQTAQYDFPAQRITVNLAPADLPKESVRYDMPIALGILAASGQIPTETLSRYEFADELALTG